ncbi:MAG: LamG domain-containing protein, partial [Phycisphaerales bacterium]
MFRKILTLISLIIVLTLASTASAELVAHWKLDDGTGTDASGNSNDGTPENNPAVVDGQREQALAFEDSRVIISPSDSLTADLFAGSFTLAGWINPKRTGNTWQQIFRSIKTNGNANDTLFLNNDGRLSWRGRIGDTWTVLCETAAGVVPANQWTHFAVTGDGTNFRIYVDAAVSQESAFQATDGTNATYYIAGNPGGESYSGMIDDLRVYNNVLTETEIKELAARPRAEQPDPADGAKLEATWVTLGWRAGDFAVSHDAYLGDNFDDVNNAAPGDPTFQGNQTTAMLIAGFFGYAYPDGLVPGTTYYWRVDEVNPDDPNSPWKGDVWSFWIPPVEAYAPSPSDAAQYVGTDVTLNWEAGFEAKLHYVHFGDNFDDVNNAAVGTPSVATTFAPGTLELGKTYYWRVDESNP